MCGLIAVLGKFGQQVSMQRLEAATRALKHRGPDDIGFYQTENVGFGFHRLSIIDLSSAAHQPMSDISGELTVVFNGEIYNYVELRAELIALGHAFRSHSDTEVLLAAYRQWGNDCVRRFNGMFAFVIHDRSSNLLFAARDRLGVKPLYLWQDDNWLVLASEPAAIGAFGMCELQADWPRLAEAICWGLMDHDNGTCFSGIHAVPAGNSLNIDARGKLAQCSYWTLPPELPTSTFIATEWLDRLAELVTDAVRLRLRSDVPVGFTLSGGIDSSLLICEAGKLHSNGGNHLAFSYQDARHDERQPIADPVPH